MSIKDALGNELKRGFIFTEFHINQSRIVIPFRKNKYKGKEEFFEKNNEFKALFFLKDGFYIEKQEKTKIIIKKIGEIIYKYLVVPAPIKKEEFLKKELKGVVLFPINE
jgi:hypothetical protein